MKRSNLGSSLILASLLHSGHCQEETACQVSIKTPAKKIPWVKFYLCLAFKDPGGLLIFIDAACSFPSLAPSTLAFCLLLVFC